jgi:proline racemase
MRFERMFTAIDTHTGGEPTRTILSGFPRLPGKTVGDKMVYMRDNWDWLRTLLMCEPRGNSVMSGAIITEPCHPDADFGVIYIESGGYLPMCGHDTIGCCTALVEAGIVPVTEPITKLIVETPAGLIDVAVAVKDSVARSVTFSNVPSYLHAADVTVDVPGYGPLTFDIAYGGNFYAILPAAQVGLTVAPHNAGAIVKAGRAIKDAVNAKMQIVHPELPYISGLTHVEFYGPPTDPDAHAKNAVVITHDAIDRSPCGTGTSAKLAALYAKGQLAMGQEFVHESIIGTIFRARVTGETKIGDRTAVIPEITGSAHVTAISQFVLDPDDPLREGFLLGE